MTERDLHKLRERRRVITSALRYAAAGVMGLGIIGAAVKRRRLAAEQVCSEGGICAGCGAYEECGLPRALSRKQALRDSLHGG